MMMPVLDFSQKRFCEAQEGNARLLAPAGCGKTLSLLFRCAYLSKKARPQRHRFLIVTFTVAAKHELVSRLNEDSNFSLVKDDIEITTLNSWGFRRVKNVAFHPKLISTKEEYHFTMLNQLQPVWEWYPELKKAIKERAGNKPRKIMGLIDEFKSLGFDHIRHNDYDKFAARIEELISQGLEPKLTEVVEQLVKIGVFDAVTNRFGEDRVVGEYTHLFDLFYLFWLQATDQLIRSATFTLEDQKYVAYLDERQKLEEGKYLSGAAKYDHILVDEFQDINPLDLALIKTISQRNRATVTIVGDDDQALFEWRGATPEYILNPSRFFNMDFSTFTLSTNYRSPKNVVLLAQRLIEHNTRRVEKSITPYRQDEALIETYKIENLVEGMRLVYAEVQKAIMNGQSPNCVAIIGRKRSQLIPYQVFFASKNVSFCAAEDLQVFMSAAFDRLLNLIAIKSQCETRQMRTQVVDDLLDLCNVVTRYPLSRLDRESLRKHLNQMGASSPFNLRTAVDDLEKYKGNLKGANINGQISLKMAVAIRFFLEAKSVSDTLTEIGLSFDGLQVDLGKAEDDIFFADPPFLYLAEYAAQYGDDYFRFVDDIEKAKQQLMFVPPFEDDAQSAEDELWKRPVHLMTAIRSKGKEFDSVILLDVNDGIWPSRNARTPEEREAERRVFYVAFTRAKKQISMLISKRLANREATVSPFIAELGMTTK
jgi:DNA helicase-2/ATP-dependent DNA helicase PcrA